MKNGDMPAMPMGKGVTGSYWTANDLGDGFAEQCKPAFGLTKREHFAAMALQGYLAAHAVDEYPMPEEREAAREAVSYADALLAELAENEKAPA